MSATVAEPVRLSVLDVGWPGQLSALVQMAEQSGFHRYWASEHHSPHQSGNAVLAAAVAAAGSRTLRVGTAATLLTFSSPLRIAEDCRLLELFFPGRFDLGIAGGGTTGPVRSALLDGRPEPTEEIFSARVQRVVELVRDRSGDLEAGPRPRSAQAGPQIWLCGMSRQTAATAGRLGLSFAYSEHLRLNPSATIDDAAAVFDALRAVAPTARTAVMCYGICAASERTAERLWSERCARRGKLLTPTFLGTPDQCCEQLAEIRARYGADELAVESFCDDLEHRLESFRLIAAAWGLTPRVAES